MLSLMNPPVSEYNVIGQLFSCHSDFLLLCFTRLFQLWYIYLNVSSTSELYYIYSSRLHGDTLSCRRAFQRAVQTNVDNPEQLSEAFVLFERAEGRFYFVA